ncbi:MAG: efflux RND transporter periplasmic adaptor subunit [Ruminococcus sp.]|nr:efflux RND transporter periplasmic adaptor subunit [Ruminococcus sp.]
MKNNLFKKVAALLCISAAALMPVYSCGGSSTEGGLTYDTYTVEKTDLENYISVSGTVEGSDLVKITSDLNTKIVSLNVELGSSVKKGDVLCVFDSSDLQAEYDSLTSSSEKSGEQHQDQHTINQRNLDNAKSDKQSALAQAQRIIDNAVSARDRAYDKYNSTVEKANNLYSQYSSAYDKAVSEGDELGLEQAQALYQQYQAAEAEYTALGENLSSYDSAVQDARDAYSAAEKNADAAIQAAQDAINAEKYTTDDSIQNQLDKLQERINKCTVTAPKDGIITALNAAEGSIPTTDAIMTIEDTSRLRINVQIKEADILSVKEGQKAVITANATGDTEFSGTVDRVVNIMSNQSVNMYTGESTGGYSAEITLDDPDNTLLIGMTAKVKIILEEKSDVLAVPYDAIVTNKDGSFSVVVAEESGGSYTAKLVDVEKGLDTSYLTEIISSGIKEGDLIVTEPDYIADGDRLRISGSYYDDSDGE